MEKKMIPVNLYESLVILNKCHATINLLWNEIVDEKLHTRKPRIGETLTHYILMETVSFLDEYETKFLSRVESEYIQRVKETKTIAAPIIDQIKKWKDLGRFRNNIVAHPWRDKKKNHQIAIAHQSLYNVPRNWMEFGILHNLVGYAFHIIESEFKQEVMQGLLYVMSLIPEKAPPTDYSNLNKEHSEMIDKVHALSNSLGKPCSLSIMLYQMPGEPDDPTVPTISHW